MAKENLGVFRKVKVTKSTVATRYPCIASVVLVVTTCVLFFRAPIPFALEGSYGGSLLPIVETHKTEMIVVNLQIRRAESVITARDVGMTKDERAHKNVTQLLRDSAGFESVGWVGGWVV